MLKMQTLLRNGDQQVGGYGNPYLRLHRVLAGAKGIQHATVAKEGDRFSEDIELTYDIRKLIADLTGGEKFLPADRSRASI